MSHHRIRLSCSAKPGFRFFLWEERNHNSFSHISGLFVFVLCDRLNQLYYSKSRWCEHLNTRLRARHHYDPHKIKNTKDQSQTCGDVVENYSTPRAMPPQPRKESFYILLVKVKGCVRKVCCNNLRIVSQGWKVTALSWRGHIGIFQLHAEYHIS